MPEERTVGLDTRLRHNLLHKIGRGLGLWWRGEMSLRRILNAGRGHLSLRRRHARHRGTLVMCRVWPVE